MRRLYKLKLWDKKMAPRFLQGIYAALGELFYIPFISGKSFEKWSSLEFRCPLMRP